MHLDHGTPKPLFPYPGVDVRLENIPSKDQQGKGPTELIKPQNCPEEKYMVIALSHYVEG